MCLKAVGQLLDSYNQTFLETKCILDTIVITMTSSTCKFIGRHFTQIGRTIIGGPESASVTDIYGTVFIDSKIEENINNGDEHWKRIEMIVFQYLCELAKKEKWKKLN